MKPWREIAIPHSDVLKGTFQQAEFAADLTAVQAGKAPVVYQNAKEYFARTFITEGMRLLLTQVALRLAGKGGEPVIQLQTAFGGGKTHTMLAVWHLATRECALADLPGVSSLIDAAGLIDLPRATVAVIDGNAHAPGQPWKQGRTVIRTLWGELAWQLGKADGFALVAEADANGTSPGKEVLRQLLERHAPCAILLDELVAYVGQLVEGKTYSGGTFESNVAFFQALTEAVKLVPNAIVLASLPQSETEAGGARGAEALRALEKRFGRVQALWKPVAAEESFGIVRRRLFETIKDEKSRNAVCRAFADAYVAEGAVMPSETQEGRYFDRLCDAYPIHPELFDRLYNDWSTIEGFQRTRGVLKLMAKVLYRLWQSANSDLMILPSSLPLAIPDVRSELTQYLPPGWDPVIDSDIDGDRAETTALESREPRFGQVQAARRVARTLFLGTAPSSVSAKPGTRGLDRGRVLLGCLQSGQLSSVYSNALDRLSDRLHYLNSSGDRAADSTRYWFDTRANLRREMEDRKGRFDDKTDVRERIEKVVARMLSGNSLFDGVHVFTPHSDVPDDSALRLVVLPLDRAYSKDQARFAEERIHEYLRNHGTQPRHRANRLLFLAADAAVTNRLKDVVRTALAWDSIVEDVDEGRLNIDNAQFKKAKAEANAATDALPRAARECFKWLLCPAQDVPTATEPVIEAHSLNTGSGTVGSEIERVCFENELVLKTWAPTHLRQLLREFYWKPDRPHADSKSCWEDSLRYLYLPRFKSLEVLSLAVRTGSQSRDFFATAYGFTDGKYEGFQFGQAVGTSDFVLLIEVEVAQRYESMLSAAAASRPGAVAATDSTGAASSAAAGIGTATPTTSSSVTPAGRQGPVARNYRGTVDVKATLAKSQLNTIAEEVLSLLAKNPNANIRITLEIDAEFPNGASESDRRSVSENARSLGFRVSEWE